MHADIPNWLSFQIIVEAYDSAVPDDVVSEVITLTVQRNNYAGQFSLDTYTSVINDYDPAGTLVGVVSATDDDVQVGHFLRLDCFVLSCVWLWFDRVNILPNAGQEISIAQKQKQISFSFNFYIIFENFALFFFSVIL